MGSAEAEMSHFLTIAPASLDASHRNNPMTIAHAALEALRDSGDEHFLFLRCILEINSNFTTANQQELLFHCITGFRQVMLWQWKKYSKPFRRAAREYFMILGHSIRNSTVLRNACYTTSVAFWKRSWNENIPGKFTEQPPPLSEREKSLMQDMGQLLDLESKQNLMDYLDGLLDPCNRSILEGATFLSCLVTEFAGKSAVSYRMPLEFHKDAHRSFEKQQSLNHSLALAMKVLSWQVHNLSSNYHPETVIAIVTLCIDCLSWEFGLAAWDTGNLGAAAMHKVLLRPPVEWRDYLAQPDLVRAIFYMHKHVSEERVKHALRQLLLQLASLSGPIFEAQERQNYASHLLEGNLELLQESSTQSENAQLLDALQLVSRIITNYRLSTLSSIPSLLRLLQGLTTVGKQLLHDQYQECVQSQGDLEAMELRDWREEALAIVLESAVALAGDPWLLYSGTEESRHVAQSELSEILGPLYDSFVYCRTKMAAIEEHYFVRNEEELDEVKEEILAIDLEDEMTSVSTMGRLNLSTGISCLSSHFGQLIPSLKSLWEGQGHVTPQTAALLEEARILTMYVCHLFTDNNQGESPAIPDAVLIACQKDPSLADLIAAAVQAILQLADAQIHKIAENPNNIRMSPLLAKSFLWFLDRWAPAYIYPADYANLGATNRIVADWSNEGKAQQIITFAVSLCLYYQCYWPHEKLVQERTGCLLLSLAKRGGLVRQLMTASPVFRQMVQYFCLTAGLRHSVSQSEFETEIRGKLGENQTYDMGMLWGFHRLAYADISRTLTAIIVACSDDNPTASTMLQNSLKSVHNAFTSLVDALSSKQVGAEDVDAKEMACLCAALFCGVAHASEMSAPERIPAFVTPYLSRMSGLMNYYASDLTVCEALLRFYCDYTEQFVSILDKEQSIALFNSSAELLRSYSSYHCASRVIVKVKSAAEAEAEEEQAYSDILCAIQLLINLGAKDFIDICQSSEGMESSQVTDVIFFGLQQILPLMTQGLLQYPTLCSQFFDLVGFMMDTYPDKVCVLPFDLFDSLLESLLYGMTHHNVGVAKCSLLGISSIAREHLKTGVLQSHLTSHPDIFDKCSRRLLTQVIFQNIVADRVEYAGLALLPLVAVDMNRFVNIVSEIGHQIPDGHQRLRLEAALTKLLQPETIAKVARDGMEGRMNRIRFKESFQEFVNEVHSFLVLR